MHNGNSVLITIVIITQWMFHYMHLIQLFTSKYLFIHFLREKTLTLKALGEGRNVARRAIQ